MDAETQAVLFNAVPLLVLAALYAAVGVALEPWRRNRAAGFAAFALAGAAAVLGIAILVDPEPLAGNTWVSLVAIGLAAVPLAVLRRVSASSPPRSEPAPEDEDRLSQRLLDAREPQDVATLLLDELARMFSLDLANLALIEDEGRSAHIVASRDRGRDEGRLIGQRIALDREPSGINAAAREGNAFAVYDAEQSAVVNQRLNAIARVKSCVFVPVRAGDEVIAVVFGAVRHLRVFEEEELARMQALTSQAGLALERTRATRALAEALERERLISQISLGLRSRHDPDGVLPTVVADVGRALAAVRCFVRIGDAGETAIVAEWHAEGLEPIGDPERLPVTNLAARNRRTIAVADVLEAPELGDATLGDLRELTRRGVRAVLAAPIVIQDRALGVLVSYRAQPGEWRPGEIALLEAVAREAAVALDTSRLLRESERRLAEQEALLKAGQALTSDLRFDAVIERLVEELRALVNADAADCWTLPPDGSELVCRAVLGLPESEIGRRIPVVGTIGEAITSGKPVLRREFAATEQPPPTSAYARFAEAMDAPIFSFGEIRGVLGVYSGQAGRFEESDLRLLEAFASLASIAIRNAEAYEESTRQTRVERGFYRIAAVLSEPLSEQETLDAVAQAAAESLGGDSAAVLRPSGADLELVGSYELPEELALHLRGAGASLGSSLAGGKVLASRRLRDDERFGDELGDAAAAAGRDSLLAVPLPQSGGREAGLVLVFFEGERSFGDDQLELAGQVAAAARGALERSDLYERERRSRHLAQRLARAGRELAAGELDPDEVLDQVARYAVDLLGCDAASVRLLEGEEVVFRAAVGPGAPEALETRAPSTAWLVGDIVQTRASRAIADAAGDPRVAEADAMLAAGYAGYLGVPMMGPEESAHGILAVYSRLPRDWREEEDEALHALAATAAAARINAELYQGVSHEQQRGEAILANVADGIVAVDREGRVVLWNPAAERITGVPQREALGNTPTEALGRPLEAAGGTPGGSRLLPIRRAGEEVWLSLSEAVMTDPAGAVAGRIFAFRDISAERSVEQMKTDFVSTVSHELRTPLTSIYGFAETLLRQDVLFGEEERATFLRYIASESERLTAIVDRLLSVAQLDTGDIAVQLAETDVGAVVSEAVRSAEGADGENGHRFVVELEDAPLAAEADRDKLTQVLAHLLDNAVRYSPAGGTVTVAARRREDAVEVSVEDEGVGIPHADQERIFRKFYRGDAAATGAVGAGATGLGLFLAEGLVTAMGGRIRVDSGEGKGSTFVLELRAAESEA